MIKSEKTNIEKRKKLKAKEPPNLLLTKIALVSRDYSELNGNSDYSKSFDEIIEYCDAEKCDSILFSPYTLLKKHRNIQASLKLLKNVKCLFIEEFAFTDVRSSIHFVVHYKQNKQWVTYEIEQEFARLDYTNSFKKKIIDPFIYSIKNRILGNCLLLICGESNIVKYSKKEKKVRDEYHFLSHISGTKVIINPVHDKMSRFEMKLKRRFLSKNKTIVVSVWNKGKILQNGKTIDGKGVPWTVYFDGKSIELGSQEINFKNNISKIEIGILDFGKYV